MKYSYIIIFGLFLSPFIQAGLIPDYDKRCDTMITSVVDINPIDNPIQEAYFNKKIPNNIHQIWFGDPSKVNQSNVDQWKKYAEKYSYQYRLWTEKDDEEVSKFMNPKNFELMLFFRNMKEYWGASDVLRYEILNAFGGLYVDCDFTPPRSNGEYIDFDLLFDRRGLILMIEHNSRNVGGTGIFLANGFIFSSPNHPMIVHMVNTVHQNAMNWYHSNKYSDASFETGPYLLNRSLSGCFTAVPYKYLINLNMWQWE